MVERVDRQVFVPHEALVGNDQLDPGNLFPDAQELFVLDTVGDKNDLRLGVVDDIGGLPGGTGSIGTVIPRAA